MASIYNPRSSNLIVLSVKIRTTQEWIDYLFPLNPASLQINQSSRVSATFTYGTKVFQNLGAGLKTISMEGHTGYKLDKYKYGLRGSASDLSAIADLSEGSTPGKSTWLDLYTIIQLIKGENKFLTKFAAISDKFSVDNIDKIETVQITIPDQGITYDVLLQNDSFLRNREQPHLYKYKLDFIVTQESLGTPRARTVFPEKIKDVGGLVADCSRLATKLKNVKTLFMGLPGVQTVSDAVDSGIKYVNESIAAGNFAITSINSTINDIRRLERITDSVNKIAANIGLIRGVALQVKTFSNLNSAFYEPYITLKHLKTQMSLLQKSLVGEQQNLQFNVSLTRLASISAPVTLAANKATVAQFQKDIRQLNRIAFPFPIDRVQEVTTDGVTKINVFFKTRPSALGISDIRIYAANDFGNENNLVESLTDSNLVMSTNYNTSGYLYNFIIEYNYTTFESITQPKYKSIKRILIVPGETLESIVKKYAPNEANASRTFLSEVAYLNGIEYPYIITSDNINFDAYFGSYGYKIFETNSEFMQYVYNIDVSIYPGINLTLYDSTDALLDDSASFLLQQQEVIDQIKTASKFFVILFKETYSNRCYALFGMTNNATCSLFTADSYVICALEKGRSYDIDNNALFEILSPYTSTGDLIEYYGQTSLFDSITDPTIALFDKLVTVINKIYEQNVGLFSAANFTFTEAEKSFLAGDDENKNYPILTNFTDLTAAAQTKYTIVAFSAYKILTDGQEILLPSFENTFLPFAEAFTKEDTYKVDLDIRFQYLDDTNVSILPRPDLGVGQGYLDFKLISGLDNVKQAIKDRLECPQGGLILHQDYGMPVLLGKKNTIEHLILLRYNLFNQLMSDVRVRSVNNMQIADSGDTMKAQASIVLVNNDETLIKTTL